MRNSQMDLESLTEFRSHLMRFNRTLADEVSSMRSHWRSLGDVWTDAKYQEFGQALEEAGKGIDRYLSVAPEHEKHLYKLMRIIEEYLNTHP